MGNEAGAQAPEQNAPANAEQNAGAPTEQRPPAAQAPQAPAAKPGDGQAASAGADPGAAPAKSGGDAAPGSEAPPSYDFTTDEGIRAAVEANPRLAGYLTKVKADAENTGAQKAQTKAQRQFAQEANVNAALEAYLGPDLVSQVPEDRRQQVGALANVARWAAGVDLIEAIGSELFSGRGVEIDPEHMQRAIEAYSQRNPDGTANPDYGAWTHELVLGAARGIAKSMKLADIPEGSPLHQDVQQAIARGVEAELRAKGTEQAAAGAPRLPATPKGGQGGSPISSVSDARGLTAADWSAMPKEQRDQLMRDLANKRGAA